MKINHIVCQSNNGFIGKDNKLLFDCKPDMNWFKEKTTGNVVFMGRRTWESIGSKPLNNRLNVVISTTIKASGELYAKHDNLLFFTNLKDALDWLQQYSCQKWNKYKNIFIIGGESIYKQTEDIVDNIYLTTIDESIDGDKKYPVDIDGGFDLVSSKTLSPKSSGYKSKIRFDIFSAISKNKAK